jgi:hypothetical protein
MSKELIKRADSRRAKGRVSFGLLEFTLTGAKGER